MVLVAAAVCNNSGKILLSRQFVELSKARIEGLLTAFPQLLQEEARPTATSSSLKQHTFVETDSVRYVYQPMDNFYMLLVTTKNSNILDDLVTLRLFARIVAEYCSKPLDRNDILAKAFLLIFAFDEVVALGYRENVTLALVRTFVDMDSQEERESVAARQAQEQQAKQKMRMKAKELQRLRVESGARGQRMCPCRYHTPTVEAIVEKPLAHTCRLSTGSKAMQLRRKDNDPDVFVNQLKSEGEKIVSEESEEAGDSYVSSIETKTEGCD